MRYLQKNYCWIKTVHPETLLLCGNLPDVLNIFLMINIFMHFGVTVTHSEFLSYRSVKYADVLVVFFSKQVLSTN
jgi:hypothetical protein